MSADDDLNTWRRQWRTEAETQDTANSAAALKRRMLRDSRRMKLGLIAPILVSLIIGGHRLLRALNSGQIGDIVLAVETWSFIVVIWAGVLWLARGTWRPAADSTSDFIKLSIRRCQANRKIVALGACLYVFQLLFVGLILVFGFSIELLVLLTSWPMILIGWVGLPLYLGWMVWYRQRQNKQHEYLAGLEHQLESDSVQEIVNSGRGNQT